jgi:branched-chain amino acid transport system substrate-binding protein
MLAIAGAVLAASTPGRVAAQDQPIKIGIMLPLSGPAGAIGNDCLKGIQYVMDGAGNTVAGKKIELLIVDDQNSATVAINEARRLVEVEKVVALAGSLNGPIALALSAYALRMKVPYITGSTATDLTVSKKNAYTFRGSSEANQFHTPLGDFLKKRGFKRGILMGSDYVTGHDTVEAVAKGFKAGGGTVVKEIFPRLGETDFAPYFADLSGMNADFVYGFFFGGDSLRFARGYRASGLKFPLIMTGSALSVGGVADQLGKDVEGILTNENWIWTLTDPSSKSFVEGFQKKFQSTPGTLSMLGFCEGMVLLEALKAVRGNATDGTALARAMERVRFREPGGQEWRYDESHDPLISIYLVQWTWRDGKVEPKVLDVIRNVKQSVEA